jgi:hypothetical protein
MVAAATPKKENPLTPREPEVRENVASFLFPSRASREK